MPAISRKKAAVLNSRQNLRPLGSDAWIKNTGSAIRHAVDDGCTILTSIGMNTWEIVLYFVSAYNARVVTYIPVEKGADSGKIKYAICTQFELNNELTDWRFIEINNVKKDKHFFQQKRDEAIVNEADIIYPISVRRNGNMERLLETGRNKKIAIRDNFRTEYSGSDRKYKIKIDPERINPNIDKLLKYYLIHWTRTSNTAWPGETKYEFYRDIVHSRAVYPRNALETLKKILTDRKVIASSRHYRKNVPAVAFSSLAPSEASSLMKWRARYREMSFEPYGIAIKRELAKRIGIRRVIYGHAKEFHNLKVEERPYFQSTGTKGFWLPENEYRFIGDLDLNLIPAESLAAIARRPDEIAAIKQIYDGQVISFLSGL